MPRVSSLVPLAASACLAWWIPGRAHACECSGTPTVAQALAGASAVFSATVVRSIRRPPAQRGDYPRVEYRVRVVRSWKGPAQGDEISLWSTGSSCDPIHGAWMGARVFFAYDTIETEGGPSIGLHVNLCGIPAEYSIEELDRLAERRTDAASPTASGTPSSPAPSSPGPAPDRRAAPPAEDAAEGCGVVPAPGPARVRGSELLALPVLLLLARRIARSVSS